MKYVFFTGATGGLGRACVEALSRTGRWTVFAAGMNEAVLAELATLPNVLPMRTDVTKQESVDAARALVGAHTETLDAIVNFAGLTALTSLVEGDSVGLIEKLLAVNVVGTARVNRAFFEMIYKGHGRIINCSSESGWMTATPFAGPYVLSKYAIEGYNDSLRRELMFLGIPVIKLQPGSFQTAIRGQINSGYEKTLAETKYYRRLLLKLKPLMVMELSQRNDPSRLAGTLIAAMEARKPRLYYRVGTGRLLALLELFPERWVDNIYMLIGGGPLRA